MSAELSRIASVLSAMARSRSPLADHPDHHPRTRLSICSTCAIGVSGRMPWLILKGQKISVRFWPASKPLQARVSFLRDDDVVVHRDAERLCDLHDRLRHLDVGAY